MADNDLIPPQLRDGGTGSVSTGRVQAPDYRQIQNPAEGIEPWRLPNNGGAAKAEELSRAFKEFEGAGQSLGDLVAKVRTHEGATAGAAAGLNPAFQPKTGLAAVTAYGSAYDAAAHLTYVNNTQASVEDQLTQAEQDNAGNPTGFMKAAQAIHDQTVKQAPAQYAPEISNMIALRTHAGMARTQQQAIDTARSDAFESYTSTIDTRIGAALKTASTLPQEQQAAVVQQTLTDNRTQLDALVKARAITPERSAILQQKFEDAMTAAVHDQYTTNMVNHFMDLARAGDVDSADRVLHQYVQDPNNSDVDKAGVTKAYLAQADAFHQAQSRLHANDIAAVGQQLAAGKYGQDIEPQIHGLYKIGALSPEGLHSLLDQSMRNQVADIEDSSSNQLLDEALHGGQKLDPTDKAVVKATDTYFRTHVAISGVPPLSDAWTTGAAGLARQTNIIPPTVLSQIRIGLISGDPQQAARAAVAAERIRQANPQIDPYANDPRSAALANEINKNIHTGMLPTPAYQLATQTLDKPKEQREIISKNYGNLVRNDPNGNAKALQSALDAAVPGLFAKAPPAPVPLQAEYERLVSTYYGLNQDLPAARALAARQVQTTWGLSQMNGQPELVKNPPERLGVTSDMIRADVAASVKGAGYNGDPSQVHLVPNSNTDSSQGRVWSLVHTDPTTGVSDVLLDSKNQPLVYHVPQGQDFAKARQNLIEQKLAGARAERDANRQNSAEQTMFEQQLADEYLNGNPLQRAHAGR
jgi:hypothetical protein